MKASIFGLVLSVFCSTVVAQQLPPGFPSSCSADCVPYEQATLGCSKNPSAPDGTPCGCVSSYVQAYVQCGNCLVPAVGPQNALAKSYLEGLVLLAEACHVDVQVNGEDEGTRSSIAAAVASGGFTTLQGGASSSTSASTTSASTTASGSSSTSASSTASSSTSATSTTSSTSTTTGTPSSSSHSSPTATTISTAPPPGSTSGAASPAFGIARGTFLLAVGGLVWGFL